MQQNQNDLFLELQLLIKNINDDLKQDAIVLIGPTGSGKTTISLFLEGIQLQKVSKHNQPRVDVQENNQNQQYKSLIGHDERGQTHQPQIYKSEYTIIDTPGFLDNRGHDQQIKNALSNYLVFSSQFRKKLILILSWRQISEKCGLDVHTLMNNIINILGLQEYDSIQNVGVIINKFKQSDIDGDIEIKQFIIEKFQSYFNESNRLVDQITPGNVFQQPPSSQLRLNVNTSYLLFLNLLNNAEFYTFNCAKKDKIPFNNVSLDQFKKWVDNLTYFNLDPKQVRTYLDAETQKYFDDRYKFYIQNYKLQLEEEIDQKLEFVKKVIKKRQLLKATYESKSIVLEIEEFHNNIYNNKFRSQQVTFIKNLKNLSRDIYNKYFKAIGAKLEQQKLQLYQLDGNIQNSYDQYRQFIQQTNSELLLKNNKLEIMRQNLEKISYYIIRNISLLYKDSMLSSMNTEMCYIYYIQDKMDQNLCRIISCKQTCYLYKDKLPYFGQSLESLQQSFIIFNNLFQILSSSKRDYIKLDHQSYIDKITQSYQQYHELRQQIQSTSYQIQMLIQKIERINDLKEFCLITINTTNNLQDCRFQQMKDLITELNLQSNSFKLEQGIVDSEDLIRNSTLSQYLN